MQATFNRRKQQGFPLALAERYAPALAAGTELSESSPAHATAKLERVRYEVVCARIRQIARSGL